MAAGISAQVLEEVRELRKEVHGIDVKLAEHMAQDVERVTQMAKMSKAVFGNGSAGLLDRVRTIEDKHRDENKDSEVSKKAKLDVKTGVIIAAISSTIGVILPIIIAKVF